MINLVWCSIVFIWSFKVINLLVLIVHNDCNYCIISMHIIWVLRHRVQQVSLSLDLQTNYLHPPPPIFTFFLRMNFSCLNRLAHRCKCLWASLKWRPWVSVDVGEGGKSGGECTLFLSVALQSAIVAIYESSFCACVDGL